MRQQRTIMGMPVIVDIPSSTVSRPDMERVFAHFVDIDERFSPFKTTSEVSRLNAGQTKPWELSSTFQNILTLAEETKTLTNGFFDVFRHGHCDPSGLVKGWAIHQAAELIRSMGYRDFYVEAGGDIEVGNGEATGQPWRIGIRHPFHLDQIVKVVSLRDHGIATSGTYERGRHIYNPLSDELADDDVVSITVIGPDIYEADRFATAAFAMGRSGAGFIENRRGLEAYMIDRHGQATMTSGFEQYTVNV